MTMQDTHQREQETQQESPQNNQEAHSMEDLLDEILEAGDDDREKVSLDNIMDAVGHSSFSPLLLLGGIIMAAPVIGDIPGMPTIMGIFVLLTASQMLFGRDHVWLPKWMLNRSFKRESVEKAVKWMRKPAKFFDRISKTRLTWLTKGPGLYVVVIACMLIALATPTMEIVMFVANIAGIAIAVFGLSLIVRDGLLALIGLLVTGGVFTWLVWVLVF